MGPCVFLEDDDFRFVSLALLALRCLRGGLREPALFLLRLPPRNFLIIFCVVSVACWDRMWPVCEGLSAISVMIFLPVRNALRPRDLVLLHSTGRTVLHRPRRKLPIPRPRYMNGGQNRWALCPSLCRAHHHRLLDVCNTVLMASYL